MISVQKTIEILKENQPRQKVAIVKLLDSLSMVLAEGIFATIDSPPYNNSAMDGFAAMWPDVERTTSENPVELNIVGESRAGHPYDGTLGPGQAIRISTGAIVPGFLDAVIPIELCEVASDKVKILEVKKRYQHIRYAGEEFARGDKLLDPDITINSSHIALMASLGLAEIKAIKRPEITIITTGSELVPFDQPLQPHQLWDSNTPMLTTAVLEAGGIIAETIHVQDDPQLTKQAILDSMQESDLIISSGGVSMGEHDHVRDMALEAGFDELFWKVQQKPGKPMFLAKKDETLLIALPGNPVSAYICFKHYIRPLIQSMQGKAFSWPTTQAVAAEDIVNKMDRKHLMRVKFSYKNGDLQITPLAKQGSGMSSTIAHADGYIILAENTQIEMGTSVEVFLF